MNEPRTLETFGGRLYAARLRKQSLELRSIVQATIASAMGVTPPTVGRWEADLKEPSLATIARLAEWLGVSPGWLAFGEGPMWGRRDGIAPIEPGVDSYTTGEDAIAATEREIAEKAREAEEAQRRRRRASGQGPVDPTSGGRAPGSGRGTPAKRPRDR